MTNTAMCNGVYCAAVIVHLCPVSPTANRHMLRALAQAGGGAFEFFDPKSKHTWAEKVRPPFRDPCHTPACHVNACALATGGVSGEAHGGSGLHFGGGEVAAVQPDGAPSCSSPPAAAGSVQRLPHPGVRLCATLHSGLSEVGAHPHAPPPTPRLLLLVVDEGARLSPAVPFRPPSLAT